MNTNTNISIIYILYIYMNKNQIEFLSKDNIGLKEGTFSTTKHIA